MTQVPDTMLHERATDIGRTAPIPVRLPSGGQGEQATPPPPADQWFLALLSKFYKWSDEVNPRLLYYWEEAYLDANGQPQVLNGGRTPGLLVNVAQHADGSGGQTGIADLSTPVDGTILPWDEAATITMDITSVAITNPSATTWRLSVGTTAGGTDIYDQDSIPTTTLTISVPGIPNDGSDFYVRFTTNGVTGPPTMDYRMSLTKQGLAFWRTDINTVTTEQLEGPAGGFTPGTDPWEVLDPLLVQMWPVTIEGVTHFMFDVDAVEWFGKILPSSYEDARYLVQLQRVTNSQSAYDVALAFSNRTSPKDIQVVATNLAEAHKSDLHGLEDGAFVRLRMARGGTYPHTVRYWFDQSAGGDGFTGTFNVVTKVCFDAQGCVSGSDVATLQYESGLLKSVDPWPIVPCPDP